MDSLVLSTGGSVHWIAGLQFSVEICKTEMFALFFVSNFIALLDHAIFQARGRVLKFVHFIYMAESRLSIISRIFKEMPASLPLPSTPIKIVSKSSTVSWTTRRIYGKI